jgi:hypothetical protein
VVRIRGSGEVGTGSNRPIEGGEARHSLVKPGAREISRGEPTEPSAFAVVSLRPRRAGVSRATENQSFICAHCGERVHRLRNGSFRNHCPACLWSVHLDNTPGDRGSTCGGLMEPVRLEQPRGKGLAVVHVCTVCGRRSRNRLAGDDPRQPDSWEAIARIQERSAKP